MTTAFDHDAIDGLGWRQGSVLGPEMARHARELAPARVTAGEGDWLIVTSHDCDITSRSLEKEPVVEVLRAEVTNRKIPDGQQAGGRNPRILEMAEQNFDREVVLRCQVHERWVVPRELLLMEGPARQLARRNARLVAEWLAKRYIRAAFPTAFDLRWREKMKDWLALLQRNSTWIQGVYLRLSTLDELDAARAYGVHLFVAVPADKKDAAEWPTRRDSIEREVEEFWRQFKSIECAGVEVRLTSRLSLADIEWHQRFDADWVSFADDTDVVPAQADMTL
jgi:hypothetical protein